MYPRRVNCPQHTGQTRLSGNMWLATLIICTTPNVNTCSISTRNSELLLTESACDAVVQSAVTSIGPYAYRIAGGCVKIGDST
jgi:hypothetical protein